MPISTVLPITVLQLLCIQFLGIQIWDAATNLKTEYREIWRARWTTLKVAYLIARYWGIVSGIVSTFAFTGDHTYDTCRILVHFVPATAGISGMACATILALRTYAIYQRPRWLRYLSGGLLFCQAVFWIASSAQVKSRLPAGVTGLCVPVKTATTTVGINFMYFLAPSLVDTVFTALSLVKAYKLSKSGTDSGLLRVFARDGLIYFIIATSVHLVSMAFYLQPQKNLQGVAAASSHAISSLMCCRLVLSLRTYATNHRVGPVSDIKIVGSEKFITDNPATTPNYDISQPSHENFRPLSRANTNKAGVVSIGEHAVNLPRPVTPRPALGVRIDSERFTRTDVDEEEDKDVGRWSYEV